MLALVGLGTGAFLYKSSKAMQEPVARPAQEDYDDQYQDGISLKAWQQSSLARPGPNPPLQTFQMTDPSHPGGEPIDILRNTYFRYEYDVNRNVGHTLDHVKNAGDYVVLQSNSQRNVVLENDLSTAQRVWEGQKIDLQYKYTDPSWNSWGPQQVLAGGLNVPNQAGNFSGMNTYL